MTGWDEQVARLEREAVGLLGVVTSAAEAVAARHPGVRRIVDVGCGPGVGTCELAARFPDAHVVAVDGSEAMLARVAERARSSGVGERVSTRVAELPGGLDDLAPADVVFASMSLHHMGDGVEALGALRGVLADGGVLVVIEHGPGAAHGHVPVIDVDAALAASGFEVVHDELHSGRRLLLAV